jgi:hypothetical protein
MSGLWRNAKSAANLSSISSPNHSGIWRIPINSVDFPAHYHPILKEFLQSYWKRRLQELQHITRAQSFLPSLTDEVIFQSDLARNLALIAQAAAGELRHTPEVDQQLAIAVEDLLGRLFVPPGSVPVAIVRFVPSTFWESDLGRIVAKARIWLVKDQLMTITQAADYLEIHLSGIRRRIDRGDLTPFHNPDTPNPQRGAILLLRSEVEQARQKRVKRDQLIWKEKKLA